MIVRATARACETDAEIHALLHESYALEAARIGCADFPPMRESVEELRNSPDSFLLYSINGTLVGVLSFSLDRNLATITRVAVGPAHLRRGIASALLRELEQKIPRDATIAVSTASLNAPAVRLYQKRGYVISGTHISPEAIALVQLRKQPASGAHV